MAARLRFGKDEHGRELLEMVPSADGDGSSQGPGGGQAGARRPYKGENTIVMMEWERPYMRALVDALRVTGGHASVVDAVRCRKSAAPPPPRPDHDDDGGDDDDGGGDGGRDDGRDGGRDGGVDDALLGTRVSRLATIGPGRPERGGLSAAPGCRAATLDPSGLGHSAFPSSRPTLHHPLLPRLGGGKSRPAYGKELVVMGGSLLVERAGGALAGSPGAEGRV